MENAQIDPNVVKKFVTFVLIGVALLALSEASQIGRTLAIGLLVIALIYVLLSSNGIAAINWANKKIVQQNKTGLVP